MYNQILELQRNYSTSAPYLTRIDNLSDRAHLYADIATFRWEQIRALPDGPQKDAQLMQTKLISHEIMKLSILQAQIRAEIELGIERVEAIKAGTETVLSFVPVVSTGVSIALLFDESKTLDEKAWELAGIIPIPAAKNLKYLGKIDNVVEMANSKMVKKSISVTVAKVLGDADVKILRESFEAGAKRWNQADIDEIISKSGNYGDEILNKFKNGEIFHVQRASDGRLVYLDKIQFEHIAEYRTQHPYSSIGDWIRTGAITRESEFPGLFEKVIREGVSKQGVDSLGRPAITYTLTIGNNKSVTVATASSNGFITTIFPN